ncbi:MAG: YbbR-like domain-containing protein [Oscillospiraceae bacterium]
MSEKFGNKWTAKISSLFFAFFLWLTVALNISTNTTVDFEVPVNILGMQKALGNVALKPVMDEYTVNVRLNGNRRALGALDVNKDLEVYADVSKVVAAGDYALNLHYNVLNNKDIDVVSVSPKVIDVKFDKLITKKFALSINLDNISVPADYVMGQPSLVSAEVTVTGPETELAEISDCKLCFDYKEELKKTTTLNGEIRFYKSDGTEIKSDNILCSYSNMDVTIPVFKIKKVTLGFDFINYPENLNVNKLKFKQSCAAIKIGCDPQKYSSINEIFLGYVDVSHLTPENNTTTFDFDSVLDKDLFNISGVSEVEVSFDMSNMAEKIVSTNQIKIINKPEKMEAKILTERIYDIRLIGNKKSISQIQGRNIGAVVDMRDIKSEESRIAVPVNITIPGIDDVWVVGTYDVYLSIN